MCIDGEINSMNSNSLPQSPTPEIFTERYVSLFNVNDWTKLIIKIFFYVAGNLIKAFLSSTNYIQTSWLIDY